MGFLQNLFSKKDDPINSYADFWKWFAKHEKSFHNAVKSGKNIPGKFFDRLEPALAQVKDGIFYLTGMYNVYSRMGNEFTRIGLICEHSFQIRKH